MYSSSHNSLLTFFQGQSQFLSFFSINWLVGLRIIKTKGQNSSEASNYE